MRWWGKEKAKSQMKQPRQQSSRPPSSVLFLLSLYQSPLILDLREPSRKEYSLDRSRSMRMSPPSKPSTPGGTAGPMSPTAAGVAGQEADNDAQEVDHAVDDGHDDVGDAVEDGHNGAADGSEG